MRLPTYALIAIILLLGAAVADAALVRVGRIVLRADGGFSPQSLPRHSYAPISFHGHANVESTDSQPVPALRNFRLEFDKDGRLTTKGLPVCQPASLAGTTTETARRICGKATVGSGTVAASVADPGLQGVVLRSPLSLFNGPRINGNATVVAHARALVPKPQTYVVLITIEKLKKGAFSYRASAEVPEFAEGTGSLIHLEAEIGRRYKAGGVKRSYVSAKCTDSILETRGRFEFGDPEHTVIEGSVFKACNPIS
ncbi:MAG TPA: hypothetical protein VH476_11305 [Solirubrobacterales bacterium]